MLRFFHGTKYREWATREDMPTIDTSDHVKNHTISIAVTILTAIAIYILLMQS